MIYDMYGFPAKLYNIRYKCPGSPHIAQEIIDTLSGDGYDIIGDQNHGIDHGAWSVLIHAFPDGDIPVIQMSLDYSQSPEWHFNF